MQNRIRIFKQGTDLYIVDETTLATLHQQPLANVSVTLRGEAITLAWPTRSVSYYAGFVLSKNSTGGFSSYCTPVETIKNLRESLGLSPKASKPEVFGRVTDVNETITNQTGLTISNQGKIAITLQNMGTDACTLQVGNCTYTLIPGDQWAYESKQDARTGIWTPIPNVVLNAATTIVFLNQKAAQ